MEALKARYKYLFQSTKGLVLVAIALISLETVFFGMLSGPMAEMGVRDVWVRWTGMQLDPMEREGRIIILYHTIAMAVVAIEVYFITGLVKMSERQRANINATITVGYLTSMIFGIWFAYFGHNYIWHGLFIFGQSLVFFAGVMLTVALWPWRKEYRLPPDSPYAHTPGGLDLERLAFFVMAVATLGSAVYGAVAGANFGNGFELFLAEDEVREVTKTTLQLAVIGHLHIMLTLIAIALTLIIGRWVDFKGRLHTAAMVLMIIGTIIITSGVWIIVVYRSIAHIIINVGSTPVLLASVLLTIYTWRRQVRIGLAKKGLTPKEAGFVKKLAALLHDPLPFGATWQMMYMNLVVTAVGIFLAIKLELVREWPWREERITLTGHWHILAGIIATIILLYYADLAGLKGRARRWFGWIVIIGSDVAFAAVTLFSTKRLYVSESAQQPLVNMTMWITDAGLFLVLVMLGLLMAWRLIDLFKNNGRWKEELDNPELDVVGKEVDS